MRLIQLVALVVVVTSVAVGGAEAQGTFAISNTSGNCGPATISVTSLASSLSLDLEVTYDPNSVSVNDPNDVQLTGLAANCMYAANPTTPGVVIISIACNPAISGTGNLARITFDPVSGASSSLQFQSCERDETTCSGTTAGSIALSNCPTIALSPAAPSAIAALPGNGALMGTACVGARLTPNGAQVASATTKITFDNRFSVPVSNPCTLTPTVAALGKTISTQVTSGNPSSTLTVTVAGNTTALPSGPLFVCSFGTPPSATLPLGSYTFSNVPFALDTSSGALGAVAGNGSVKITSCNGDCDGSGGVLIGEVVRALNEFGGTALCNPADAAVSCPAADTDLSGAVQIGEVVQSLNRFGGSSPCPP